MPNDQRREQKSRLLFSLELEASLYQMLASDAQLYHNLQQALRDALSDLMGVLGIPGDSVVQLSAFEKSSTHSDQFLRVRVHNRLCRYPDALLYYVHSYVNRCPLDPRATPANLLVWLTVFVDDEMGEPSRSPGSLIEFLVLTCMEIVKREPGVLLSYEQVADYVASLPNMPDTTSLQTGSGPLDIAGLELILQQVLNLRISIADTVKVGLILGSAHEHPLEELPEDLIDGLRQEVVEIQFPAEGLRQITTFDQKNGPSMFLYLREGLFEELGIRYPLFRFVSVDTLKAGSFAFKIHHLTTLPFIGLSADQCLVNETSARLHLMNVAGQPAMNPASDVEGSLIALESQQLIESAGLAKWDQIEYLVLCMAACLRANSACFVYKTFVQNQFERLSLLFPVLTTAVQSILSVTPVTSMLRSLVTEGIVIKNLKLISEVLAEYSYGIVNQAAVDETNASSALSRLASSMQRIAFTDLMMIVRAGLKFQIKQKYSRGTGTVVAYLIDQEIEEIVSQHLNIELDKIVYPGLDNEWSDKIIDAIRNELTYMPAGAQVPILLTTERARLPLFKIINAELPYLVVLCYSDLPDDTNIQPVARISLNI